MLRDKYPVVVLDVCAVGLVVVEVISVQWNSPSDADRRISSRLSNTCEDEWTLAGDQRR